jgi:hypothetical protein
MSQDNPTIEELLPPDRNHPQDTIIGLLGAEVSRDYEKPGLRGTPDGSRCRAKIRRPPGGDVVSEA